MRGLRKCAVLLFVLGCTESSASGGPAGLLPDDRAATFQMKEGVSVERGARRYDLHLELPARVAAIQGEVWGSAMAACRVSREQGAPGSAFWALNQDATGNARFAAFAPETFDVSDVLTLTCDSARLQPGDALGARLVVAGTESGEPLGESSLPVTRFVWSGDAWTVE